MDHPFPHLHIKLYYCTSGGNKLEIPAQTTRMSFIRETSVIGRVFFKIEKTVSFGQKLSPHVSRHWLFWLQ